MASCLYSVLPETIETAHAKEASELYSEVHSVYFVSSSSGYTCDSLLDVLLSGISIIT